MTLPFLRSEAGSEPVVVEGRFEVSVERLFHAWTDAAALKRWFGPAPAALESVSVDLRPGGRWSVRYLPGDDARDQLEGTYETIKPNQELAFTWQHHRHFADGRLESSPRSLVTITFNRQGSAVIVRLVHSQIEQAAGRLGVSEGWSATFTHLSALLNDPA